MFKRLMQKLQLSSTKGIQSAIWVVLILLGLVLVSFAGYYYWDRYVRLEDQSPLERDIATMEEVILENPDDPDARVALAEFYLNKGMHQQALDQTSGVLEAYPENEGALLITGVTYVRMNEFEAALDPLERFAALRKDLPMANMDSALEAAYYYLGASYMELNRPAEAIPALEAALEINRTDADALYQLGLAYQADGQPEAALEQYHEAVRFVPDFREAYSGMIASYTALNQENYVTYAQGMEALSLQDYTTAKAHLERAANALPDFAPAFLGLGLTYEQLGELEAALAAVERGLAINPDDFAAQQAAGRIRSILSSQE